MSKPERSERKWLNDAFTALSDPMRREIVEVVIQKPGLSVNDICQRFPVSRFTVMRHLNILEDAGLLVRERDGTTKMLFINREKIHKLTSGWLRKVSDRDFLCENQIQ